MILEPHFTLAWFILLTSNLMLTWAFFLTCKLVNAFGAEHEATPTMRYWFRKSNKHAAVWFFGINNGLTIWFLFFQPSGSYALIPALVMLVMATLDLLNDIRVSHDMFRALSYSKGPNEERE